MQIWLSAAAVLLTATLVAAKNLPFTILKPKAGHVWVYNPYYDDNPIQYLAMPNVPLSALPERITVFFQEAAWFGKTLYAREIKTKSFFPDKVIQEMHPKIIDIAGPQSPHRINEGNYQIVMKSKNGTLLGQSPSIKVLNSLPRTAAGVVKGFYMTVRQGLYKLQLSRQLSRHEELRIDAVNAYKTALGGAFFDHSRFVRVSAEVMDECFGVSQVCHVPMPQFDYNSGIFFEVYLKTWYGSSLQLRTKVYYETFETTLVQYYHSTVAGGKKVLREGLNLGWVTLGALIKLGLFMLQNPALTLYTAGGIGMLVVGNFLLATVQHFLEHPPGIIKGLFHGVGWILHKIF